MPTRFFQILFLVSTAAGLARSAPAAAQCSEESQYLVGKAGVCFNQKDFGCTRLTLEQVLAREPTCARALHLQSFLLMHDGQEEEAERLRRRAEALDPSLEKFWEERGHAIENQSLTTQEFSHFILKFNGGGNRDNAWKAVGHLNAAYDFLVSRFGETPAQKVEVIVFTGEEFMDAWRAPFVGGFFDRRDGKVRVRVDDFPGGEEYFRTLCRHEFTHAFMHQYSSLKDMPLWFVEGSAEFYAYYDIANGLWKEELMEKIRRTVRGYPAPALAEINDTIEKKRSMRSVYLAYLYGQAFVVYLARQRGDSWIPNLMKRRREGMSFEDAFKDVMGYGTAYAYDQFLKSFD